MKHELPNYRYYNMPCSWVVLHSANDDLKKENIELTKVDNDGYCTLKEINSCIRKNFKVKKYFYFPRDKRRLLKEIAIPGKAIICVYGHYIYVNEDTYYSFFNNDDDPVVAIWFIE